jgi:carbamoyltransferase
LSASKHGKKPRKIGSTFTPYLGPSFSNERINAILVEAKITNFKELEEEALIERTAQALNEGKIVGWYQGRMEVGSRALGNRSILANPTLSGMKDKINREVKRREAFRPFAPAIQSEYAHEWIDFTGQENPYETHKWMLQAAYVLKDVEKRIPAVTHVDRSVRPQLVQKEDNLLFWKLIEEFRKLSGVPILLNTSLNVRGEPIICTPEEALRCFFSHGLDILVMGNFVLDKNE